MLLHKSPLHTLENTMNQLQKYKFLQIFQLYIHDVNLSFHHITEVLIELRSGESEGHSSPVNSLSVSPKPTSVIPYPTLHKV